MMVFRLPVPQLPAVLLLLLFCSQAFAATTVSSCANLSSAGETYTLNQSVSINGSSCFNIIAQNVTLDCAGHSVVGNNATGTYGAYSDKRNTTIKNCDITKFQVGVYFLAANSSSILNSSLYADATMPLCSSYEYSECTDHAGCSAISFCSDGGQCEAITDENECLTAGDGLSCSWEGGACHRLNDCSRIEERGPCEYYLCTWADSCTGTQLSCVEQDLCRAIDIVNSSSTGISGVSTNTTKGLRIVSSSSVLVSDSSFVSNVSTAILVEASNFLTFSNVNSSSVESFALFINNSNSGIFNSLRALSTNLQAVRFYYSSNNNVSNSNISNNHPTFNGGGYSAFNMDHSGNNTINSTYLYSSGGVGIVSDNSIDNNYSNLTIRTKEDVCIFLLGSSNWNRISNNDLYSLNNTPVRIVDSLYNLVEHSVLRSDTASAMCIMDSGNNNTFNNITANSTGPAWAGGERMQTHGRHSHRFQPWQHNCQFDNFRQLLPGVLAGKRQRQHPLQQQAHLCKR